MFGRKDTRAVETRRDRMALAADAGRGPISVVSVLAGTLVAFGAFAVLAAIAGAVTAAVGLDSSITSNEWQQIGAAGAAVLGLVLFLSYFFGGYAAGRMARRGGVGHGILVFITGLLAAGVVAAVVRSFGGDATDDILANFRNVGLPTTWGEWQDFATIAGVVSLAAMLLGSLFGGLTGERWHGKLLADALDPEIGTTGVARRKADDQYRVAGEAHTTATRRVARTRGDVLEGRDDRIDVRDNDGVLEDEMDDLRSSRRR